VSTCAGIGARRNGGRFVTDSLSKQPIQGSDVTENSCSGDRLPEGCSVIEVHLRTLTQLFDSLDPSPFHERDLDGNAEEYIVESVQEQAVRGEIALVLYIDQPAGLPDEGRMVGEAIRVHFARRAQLLRRDLRQLLRRGWISLGIGLGFLAAVFLISQMIGGLMGESALATLPREGLLIVGWVAMWRPLEIFLYDWWPLLGKKRLHERLSRMKVRIIYKDPARQTHESVLDHAADRGPT
jgi:hypothetical protein